MSISVVVGPDRIFILTHYDPDLVSVIKSIPGREWDKTQKSWSVPSAALPIVKAKLSPLGARFYVDLPRPAPSTTVVVWADAMFTALKPTVRERAYLALARALHPDLGGDEAAMKALNASWESYRSAS